MKQGSRNRKILLWTGGIVALFLVLVFIALQFAEEPLRRQMEKRINDALDGYSVTIADLDLHIPSFSVSIYDFEIRQEANPDPAVAVFARIDAKIHWHEIFSRRLVSNWKFHQPRFHLNIAQLETELEDEILVGDRGWGGAFENIYPIEINRIDVTGGEITYIDKDIENPLHLTQIMVRAENIRTIPTDDQERYPSPVHLDAVIFGEGRLLLEGKADFISGSHPGGDVNFRLEQIPLKNLAPVVKRFNVWIAGGTFSMDGRIEYAPDRKDIHIRKATVEQLHADYVMSGQSVEEEIDVEEVSEQVTEGVEEPGMNFRIDKVEVIEADMGLLNTTQEQEYRLFISGIDATLKNVADRFRKGPADFRMEGWFMGSGHTLLTAQLRPEKEGPDFDFNIRIGETDMTRLNDLLRAFTGLDVVEGTFLLFMEITVSENRINGYTRPFFRDLQFYDPEQEQGFFDSLYEALADGVARIFENPREEVVTDADISGAIEDPQASIWQIIQNVIRNAFFDIILPGFRGQAEE